LKIKSNKKDFFGLCPPMCGKALPFRLASLNFWGSASAYRARSRHSLSQSF